MGTDPRRRGADDVAAVRRRALRAGTARRSPATQIPRSAACAPNRIVCQRGGGRRATTSQHLTQRRTNTHASRCRRRPGRRDHRARRRVLGKPRRVNASAPQPATNQACRALLSTGRHTPETGASTHPHSSAKPSHPDGLAPREASSCASGASGAGNASRGAEHCCSCAAVCAGAELAAAVVIVTRIRPLADPRRPGRPGTTGAKRRAVLAAGRLHLVAGEISHTETRGSREVRRYEPKPRPQRCSGTRQRRALGRVRVWVSVPPVAYRCTRADRGGAAVAHGGTQGVLGALVNHPTAPA